MELDYMLLKSKAYTYVPARARSLARVCVCMYVLCMYACNVCSVCTYVCMLPMQCMYVCTVLCKYLRINVIYELYVYV